MTQYRGRKPRMSPEAVKLVAKKKALQGYAYLYRDTIHFEMQFVDTENWAAVIFPEGLTEEEAKRVAEHLLELARLGRTN